MSQIFVSYSRADHDKCVELVRRLRKLYGNDNVWFDDEVHGGAKWWELILSRVEWSDIFVFLVSRESLESPYCKKELQVAIRRGKKILPILIRARANVPHDLAQYQWIDASSGFTADTMTDVTASINALAHEIERSAPVVTPLEQDDQEPPTITGDQKATKRGISWLNIAGASAAVIVGLLIIMPLLNNGNNSPISTATATVEQVAQADTPSTPEPPPLTVTPSHTVSPTETFTPSITPTPTNTLDLALIVGTLDANATLVQATQNALATAAARATEYALMTRAVIDATATATLWTMTPTSNITASIEAFRTMQAATNTQAWIDSWTDTPTPTYTSTQTFTFTPTHTPTATFTRTPTNTPIPLGYPGNPVTANEQWTQIVTQDFDGVTMVLVPAGCFDMGNDPEAYNFGSNDDGGRQCFDEPFWIDQTEVTQVDFARLGGTAGRSSYFTGNDRPVEQITWVEARDFCASRDARLPTEAEWEYAARGPSNLLFPWGNEWNPANAMWNSNSNLQTANAGSIPAGASWVGALDMIGNVREWVSSLSMSYPYNDSRENDNNINSVRVVRGGSWFNDDLTILRASSRISVGSDNGYYYLGFRCGRSYNSEP